VGFFCTQNAEVNSRSFLSACFRRAQNGGELTRGQPSANSAAGNLIDDKVGAGGAGLGPQMPRTMGRPAGAPHSHG